MSECLYLLYCRVAYCFHNSVQFRISHVQATVEKKISVNKGINVLLGIAYWSLIINYLVNQSTTDCTGGVDHDRLTVFCVVCCIMCCWMPGIGMQCTILFLHKECGISSHMGTSQLVN